MKSFKRVLRSFVGGGTGLALVGVVGVGVLISEAKGQTSDPARSLSNGERVLWQWNDHGPENPENIVTITPLLDGTTPQLVVATNGEKHNLHLFEARQGRLVWETDAVDAYAKGSSWGDRNLILTNDINKDGQRELVWGTAWGSRALYTLDRVTGQPLWMFDSFKNPLSEKSGWILDTKTLKDLNEDGRDEVLFAVGRNDKSVYLADGRSGQLHWRFTGWDSPNALTAVSDVNGDGVEDVAVGFASRDGRIVMLDGRWGPNKVLWSYRVENTVSTLDRFQDISGDGHEEVLATSWDGRLLMISGASGKVEWEKPYGHFVTRTVLLEDLNGDGIREILLGHTSSEVMVISGRDGQLLWKYALQSREYHWAVDQMGDLNGDGLKDIAVGTFSGRVLVLSGRDGKLIWQHQLSTAKILTLRAFPDLNGDGFADLAVGTQRHLGAVGAGTLFMLSGQP